MTVKSIVLLAMLLSAPTVVTTMAAPPEHADQDMPVVIGMLEELDIGQTVVFRMTRPDLFKGLSVGERIGVRLDDQGHVIRVMDMTVPELPSPEK